MADTRDTEQKQFLFLGDSEAGGAASQLAVANIPYIKKRLESRVSNWEAIIQILRNEALIGVLIKLNAKSMEKMCTDEYADVRERLFAGISAHPHIVFVHDSFYGGTRQNESDDETYNDGDHDDWFGDDYFKPLSDDVTALVTDLLDRHDVQVVPYERNVEINVLAASFVDEQQRNVLFRFYVPKGKAWARETSAILALFREYLSTGANVDVRQTSHVTATGTIYEFSGGNGVTEQSLSERIESFSDVMDLCLRAPGDAQQKLVALGLDRAQAEEVVDRYSKELRRLAIDIKQEREKLTMRIRHRCENELSETLTGSDLATVEALVDMIVPNQRTVISTLGLGGSGRHSGSGLTINIRPQIIGKVEGIVAQELTGAVTLGPGAREMIDLIDHLGGARRATLTSAVYELEDPSTPADRRLSAGARLKAFAQSAIRKGGEKLVEAGGDALIAYLRSKIGL